MKRKGLMPSYYRKNIAQHAQKKFFARRGRDREAEERRQDRQDAEALYQAERRTDRENGIG